MFEEYIDGTWICPKCGEIKAVRVDETVKKGYKRNSLGIFELTGIIHSNLRVYCDKCGCECYMG